MTGVQTCALPICDYSDVQVTSPYGAIPWPEVSRFNDDEIKDLMIDVVNRAYRFIHTLFDESTGAELLIRLAERDPAPRWNDPTLTETEPPKRTEER